MNALNLEWLPQFVYSAKAGPANVAAAMIVAKRMSRLGQIRIYDFAITDGISGIFTTIIDGIVSTVVNGSAAASFTASRFCPPPILPSANALPQGTGPHMELHTHTLDYNDSLHLDRYHKRG